MGVAYGTLGATHNRKRRQETSAENGRVFKINGVWNFGLNYSGSILGFQRRGFVNTITNISGSFTSEHAGASEGRVPNKQTDTQTFLPK
jgi:hypothetical protein